MKNKFFTGICAAMVFVPWTIFALRTFAWALQSPAAEMIIYSYAAFMIFGGVFTAITYAKGKVQNNLMKICLLINGLYAAFGVMVFGQLLTK